MLNNSRTAAIPGSRDFDAACLITGQLLTCASSFFWNSNGSYSVNSSTLIILSMVFWVVGWSGIFSWLREKYPWYAMLGFLYAIYGCIGGVGFGFEGLFSEFQQAEKLGVKAHEQFPNQMNLVLFWSGPAFPLSLLILGGFLISKKLINPLTGALIIIGALAFPVSRIIRVEWVAHLADFILLAGVMLMTRRSVPSS